MLSKGASCSAVDNAVDLGLAAEGTTAGIVGRVTAVVVVDDVVTVVTVVVVRVTSCCCSAGGIGAKMGWAVGTTATWVGGLSFLL